MTTTPHTEHLRIVPVASEVAGPRVIRLEGELDIASAAVLRAWLQEFDARPLTLDLSGLSFTDSTGLATLLRARTRALQHGTRLSIRGAAGQTLALLERTGMLLLLDDRAGAV